MYGNRLTVSTVLMASVFWASAPPPARAATAEEQPDLQAVMAAMQRLRQEVDELRAQQDQQWLNERRAEEVKTLIRDVLSDADTRASLLEEGMTGGHNGKRFFLSSSDGSFLLTIAGQIQFRYIASFQDRRPVLNDDDEEITVVDDEGEGGFVIRRAKIEFAGHIGEPRLKYAIQIAVDRSSNSVLSDKIVISYDLADNLTLWGGEDKAPFLREELTSSKRQLAVERSYVNEIFTIDKAQGVGLRWKGDSARTHVMINDGYKSGDAGTKQFPFTQSSDSQTPVDEDGAPLLDDDDNEINLARSSVSKDFNDDQTDFAITARAEMKLAGDWKQMKDFAAWEGEEFGAFVGAAVHYEVGETGDSSFNNNFVSWTVDGSIESAGLNAYAAVMGSHIDLEHENQVLGKDYDLIAFLVQAGYMVVPNTLEPFVRYEYIDFDDALGSDFDEVSIITAGVNTYFTKHNAKFTLDAVWALDPIPVREEGLGLQQDDPGGDGQIVLRAQFQLLF